MKKRLLSMLAIAMMIATTIQAQVPTNGLVAWYPFSGNVMDSSGNGNNGTNYGATLTTDRFGKVNSAYNFNGNGNYITVPNSSALVPSDITINVWCKVSGNYILISKLDPTNAGSYCYSVYTGNNAPGITWNYIGCSNPGGGPGSFVNGIFSDYINKWTMITAVVNHSGVGSIYCNGKLLITQNTNKIFNGCNSSKSLLQFGHWWNGDNQWLNGNLDDIRIYNRTLDSLEVQALYHEGGYDLPNNSIPTNGLVAWYPFSGNAIDSSGNGNNGTVNGASLTIDRFGKSNSAYSFNGNSQYISVPNSTSLSPSEITVNMWIKPVIPLNSDMTILSKMNHSDASSYGYGFQIQSKPYYFLKTGWSSVGCSGGGGTSDTGTNRIANNIWAMVTVSITHSGTCKNYINGKLVDSFISKSISFAPCSSSSSELRFGEWWQFDPQWFNGLQDDIRIYNRVLDSTEVLALYHESGYALPVSIININAVKNVSSININWHTAAELNTSHFILEHSTEGESFKEIGRVNAIGNGENSYEISDTKPANGINYYRLQSVDKDGSGSYSKVVCVQIGDKQSFSIVPNPANDFATISLSKTIDKATIAVYDITGKQVIKQSLNGTNSYKLNTQSLKSGLYVIKVNTTTGNYNEKLLINK